MIALRCYDLGHGSGGRFCDWLASLASAVRSEIEADLEVLQTETSVSSAERLKTLGRTVCRGLVEIVIDFRPDNFDTEIHIRILGFASGPHEFVLLQGFQKENNLVYATECPRAQVRKDGVLRDGRRAVPCHFP
jgi:Phage derived protein Gp49-like (DUF891)